MHLQIPYLCHIPLLIHSFLIQMGKYHAVFLQWRLEQAYRLPSMIVVSA